MCVCVGLSTGDDRDRRYETFSPLADTTAKMKEKKKVKEDTQLQLQVYGVSKNKVSSGMSADSTY